MHRFRMVAKTLMGLEGVLAKEINLLGGEKIEEGKRVVSYWGDKELLYQSNLYLRTALRILVPVHKFVAQNDDELYEGVKKFRWGTILSPSSTFAIDAVCHGEIFTHSQYVALKSKDAIVDQFRERYGMRPSVDTKKPSLQVHIFIQGDQVEVSLDSSGEPLFKRGYRVQTGKAPLNEVLAAGIVSLSGWRPQMPLHDPMCGSGTILTEAAMMALRLPACILRKDFAFQKWNDYDDAMWWRIRRNAKELSRNIPLQISGSDITTASVRAASRNLKMLGLNSEIEITQRSFFNSKAQYKSGMIITNPPYDERLKSSDIIAFYQEIGDTLKKEYTGFQAWILSGNIAALKQIGLHADQKIPLLNGSIETSFNRYELYEGSLEE